MAKNYAKFVPPKSRTSRKKKWRVEVVVAIFLVVTGATAFGSFLYVERTQEAGAGNANGVSLFSKFIALIHPKKPTVIDMKLAANKKSTVPGDHKSEPVHFDFYNELPNMQMPADDAEVGATNPPAPSTTTVALPATAEAPAALPAPVVAEAALPQSDEPAAAAMPVIAVAKPAQPSPVKAVSVASPPKTVAPKSSAATPDARIFNPEEVSDLLAAEHGVGRYIIQLGVFQSEDAANRLREAIVSVGFDVVIIKVKQGSQKLYHVQQGPYETAALAKLSQQRLQKRGIISIIKKA
jgi:cell division protein FtsN